MCAILWLLWGYLKLLEMLLPLGLADFMEPSKGKSAEESSNLGAVWQERK